MAGLTSTGFDLKTFEDIDEESKTSIRDNIHENINLTETSALGQLVSVTASQVRQLWEAAQAIYASMDIDQAEGDALTSRCALTGTVRRAATNSTVLVDVTLSDTVVYGIGTLTAYPTGSPQDLFSNVASVTGLPGPVTGVLFEAQETGVVRAEAGALVNIVSPPAGFTAITNPTAATLGSPIETDTALRTRQRENVAKQGAHTTDAIRTDIAAALPTSTVMVFENDTDVTVNDIPPHAIEVLLEGGSETQLEILNAIYANKPAGIRAYGTTSANHTNGQSHVTVIGYTVPTPIPVFISLTLTVLPGTFVGADLVRSAIVEYYDANNRIGRDVIRSRVEAICSGLNGVLDVEAKLGKVDLPSTLAQNLVIETREIAAFSTSPTYIGVTTVEVPGAP